MPILCESMVEEASVDYFESGPGLDSLRYPLHASPADAVLTSAVRSALRRLNAEFPGEAARRRTAEADSAGGRDSGSAQPILWSDRWAAPEELRA